MSESETIRRSDELAIRRVASEIDRAVDDKDWAWMRRNVADKITVDVGAVSGASLIEMTGDDFVNEVQALNARKSARITCITIP